MKLTSPDSLSDKTHTMSNRAAKPTVILVALTAILPSCGSLDGLISFIATVDPIPLRVQSRCSPLFRNEDIQAIIVGINTARDEGTTKGAAITAAESTCSETADAILEAQDEENPQFDALDSLRFSVDCSNCYIAIIDRLYD